MATNIMSVPPVREAITAFYREPHDKIGAKYSVTELLQPPRVRQLCARNAGLLEGYLPDPEGLWRAFSGTGVHYMFETYLRPNPDWIVEGRVWDIIDGVRIAGRIDAFQKSTGTLYDFKLTKMYKYKMEYFDDWTQQQNIYAWMLRNTFEVRHLNIVGIWIDYFRNPWRNKHNPDEPEDMITIVPLERWSERRAAKFLRDRINQHETAEQLPTDELPLCTPEDRWQTVLYKVMAPGRQRALRSVATEREARAFIKHYRGKIAPPEKLKVTKIVGEPKRCRRWCAAAKFCDQWKDELDAAGNWRPHHHGKNN